MGLHVSTRKNNLKTSNAKYVFISKSAASVTLRELIDRMANANTTITRADVCACMEVLQEQVFKLLADGYRVELPFVDLYLQASGTADDQEQRFLPGRKTTDHKITLHACVDKNRQEELVSAAAFIRTNHTYAAPKSCFGRITAMIPNTQNYVKEGDIIRITGSQLNFDPSKEPDGLYFVSGKTTVKAVCCPINEARQLAVQIPAGLPPGPCSIRLCRSLPGDKFSDTSCALPFSIGAPDFIPGGI